MKHIFLSLMLLALFTLPAQAAHKHLEKEYQAVWCNQHDGMTEVVLEDQTRVDCVTVTHAIEVDFAKKWAEAIGQALFYGIKTGRRPGVLLILERPADVRYLKHLEDVADRHGISVWTITPAEVSAASPH